MTQELRGKIAIVTGGAGGIGKASVEAFVREGARVIIADINDESGKAMEAELGSDKARYVRTDVSQEEQVKAVVEFAIKTFGGLNIMFNNAGISGAMYSRFLDDDFKDFHKVIGINLFGVLMGCRYAGLHMREHGGGVILNNASIAGLLPGHALMSYRSTKAAIIMLSKSLSIDLAEYGIRVCCLAPGHIRTSLTAFSQPGMTDDQVEKVKAAVSPVMDENMPLKRHGKPQDVAEAALFLASDRAAQITGVVLPVDAGITAGDPVNHMQKIMEARAAAIAEL